MKPAHQALTGDIPSLRRCRERAFGPNALVLGYESISVALLCHTAWLFVGDLAL